MPKRYASPGYYAALARVKGLGRHATEELIEAWNTVLPLAPPDKQDEISERVARLSEILSRREDRIAELVAEGAARDARREAMLAKKRDRARAARGPAKPVGRPVIPPTWQDDRGIALITGQGYALGREWHVLRFDTNEIDIILAKSGPKALAAERTSGALGPGDKGFEERLAFFERARAAHARGSIREDHPANDDEVTPCFGYYYIGKRFYSSLESAERALRRWRLKRDGRIDER